MTNGGGRICRMTAEWGMKRMKTKGIIFTTIVAMAMAVGVGNSWGATNEVSGLLQKGLFEEEANRNLDAAILAYQAVVAQTDKDRQFAATAIFRLGECYRKQGKVSEANAQYQRILREFADQKELATLSRQQLGGAVEQPPNANVAEQYQSKPLSAEQVSNIKKLAPEKQRVAVQQMFPNPVLNALMEKMTQTEQELATLKSNFGDKHPDVQGKEALLKAIYQQVDDQVDGVLSRQMSNASATRSGGESAASPGFLASAARDRETDFIKRIQTMTKDSPDLINAPDSNFAQQTPLHAAVSANMLKATTFLLDNKADIEVRDAFGLTALLKAAQRNQKEMVELLANRGADINATAVRNYDGFGALHFAAEGGDKAMVETLLGHGAKVDLRAANDVTPLMVAARKGFKTVAEALLAKGADINAKDSLGNTALAVAIRAGNKAIAEWLLANKADPNIKDRDGKTTMFIAVKSANKAIVELLVANGAEINTIASDSKSPLFTAIDNGNTSMVELLLSNNADVNWKTMDRITPLMASISGKHFEVTKTLVEHGADLNAQTSEKNRETPRWTALAFAVSMNDNDTVKFLVEHHADPNATFDMATAGNIYQQNCTPLMFAAMRKNLEAAKILVEHGADPNLKERNGNTAMLEAWDYKDRAMALLLLENKADPGMKYSEGRTLLHFAVIDGNQDFAGLLLDHGAPVNATDDYGKTPLHLAVEKSSQPLVELLLAHGADVNAKDKQGDTPLDVKAKSGSARPVTLNPYAGQVTGGAPFVYQWSANGEPGAGTTDEIDALLRQHGGVAEVDVATVRVMRNGKVSPTIIFRKDAAGYNHYTLHEIILQTYGPLMIGNTQWNQSWGGAMLKFPDFSKLKIYHLRENGRTNVERADLEKTLSQGDCSQNISLKWGDIVDVPEMDHKVSEDYSDLPLAVRNALAKCLVRQVSIKVKGQTTRVRLVPDETDFPVAEVEGVTTLKMHAFWLRNVVFSANVVLASSDLTRVAVKRGSAKEIVVDLGKEKATGADLWVEDGDVIEIPEKAGQ